MQCYHPSLKHQEYPQLYTSATPRLSTMQVKSVKAFVKDVKRRLSHKHKRKASSATTATTSESSPPSTPSAHHSPLYYEDHFAPNTIITPTSPRSGSSSATLSSRPSSDVIDISSKHSRTLSESEDMMSAHTHRSDNSGTFVTADWGPAESPRVRAKSLGRNSSVAPASIAESVTSSHPSLYDSAQSMPLPLPQEDSVSRPSQLQTLPEDGGEGLDTLSPVLEPEVPDPFIVEDSEGASSEGEVALSEGEGASPAVEEIALAQSAALSQSEVPPSLPSPNVNKDVPPPPASDAESEAPELYLPGLTMPTMFLPIPNVRLSLSYTLTWWFHQRPPLMYRPCTIRRTL